MLGVYRQVLTRGDLTDDPSQSAVSDLLDALRAGAGVDLVRESVRIVNRPTEDRDPLRRGDPDLEHPEPGSAPTRR